MQLSLDTSTTHCSYLFPGACGGWLLMHVQGLRFHQGLRACEAAATRHRKGKGLQQQLPVQADEDSSALYC